MPKRHFHLHAAELRFTFSRASGAGGQNVNKTATKAVVHWSVGRSRVLTAEEKSRLREKLKNKINFFDELVTASEEERSQSQNRARAIARLEALVAHALIVPKKRRPTRPTRASKIRRLESKIRHSRVKAGRRGIE